MKNIENEQENKRKRAIKLKGRRTKVHTRMNIKDRNAIWEKTNTRNRSRNKRNRNHKDERQRRLRKRINL